MRVGVDAPLAQVVAVFVYTVISLLIVVPIK
jgi:hypothetical protein